jgi:hypothetical protein
VLTTQQTTEHGVAGKTGTAYGETTPSVTSVQVIGEIKNDYAINVHFDDLKTSFWFAPELLEFVDDGAGAEITLDGVNKKRTRNASGGWDEENLSQTKKPGGSFGDQSNHSNPPKFLESGSRLFRAGAPASF